MKEIWKDIEGYAGYQISSLGNIRSIDRYVASKNGSKRLLKGQYIPPIIRGEGDDVTYIAVLRKMVSKRIAHSESSLHQLLSTTQKIIKMYGILTAINIITRQAISSGGELKIMMM